MFLAANGYWLMYFQNLKTANSAGQLINRSLSSPQFNESINELVRASTCEKSLDEIVDGWVTLLDKRDKETKSHTKRVADLAVRLAKLIGLNGEKLENFYRSALLHNIGKIVIPDEIARTAGLAPGSAIVISEFNRFTWPGFDIRPLMKQPGYIAGRLPPRFTTKIIDAITARRAAPVDRD